MGTWERNYKPSLRSLKGPKLEILGSRVLTQSINVLVGDLGTEPKNSKFDGFGRLENRHFLLFSAVGDTAVKNFKRCRRQHIIFRSSKYSIYPGENLLLL
jgi:hypothetical protein